MKQTQRFVVYNGHCRYAAAKVITASTHQSVLQNVPPSKGLELSLAREASSSFLLAHGMSANHVRAPWELMYAMSFHRWHWTVPSSAFTYLGYSQTSGMLVKIWGLPRGGC